MFGGMHLHCLGEGRPTVVLESGIAASSLSWVRVHNEIAAYTRVCAYDRAGLAWSQPSNTRRSGGEMVNELRALLAQAGEQGPYVIVGHSFGGLLARLYAAGFPSEVAGLVLIDPPPTSEWAAPSPERLRMLRRGVALSRRGKLLATVGFVRLSLALLSGGSRSLPKLMAKLSSGKGASVPERLVGEVRKLPSEVWPAVQSHWSRPEAFESMAQHLEALPSLAAEVLRQPELGSIPLTIISQEGGEPSQTAEHESIARLSTRGKHFVAENCGHWIHLDHPDLVVGAVREILALYR